MYYLGIDGGGPYSRIIGADENMKVIGRHAGNGIKLPEDKSGTETARNNLRKLISEFNRLTNTVIEECKGVCLGSSSSPHPNVAEQLMQDAGLTCPVLYVPYKDLLLATETKGKPGILVFSGMNSYGYSRDDKDAVLHCGGWGHFLDKGSGFHIGLSAVRSAFMAFDGNLPSSELMNAVINKFGVKSVHELRDTLYTNNFNKTKIAELSFAVKYLSEKDPDAQEIENQAAVDLYQLAKILLDQSLLANPIVVLSGSTLIAGDNIRSKLTALIKKDFPKAVVLPQKEKPEMGAVYLIMEKLSKST